MKKKLIVLSAALLIVLFALPIFAANVSGKWTAEAPDPDGNPGTITYVFKQEGTRLTGTVALSDQTADISSGKVDGDKISFAAVFGFGTITHTGTVQGDEIAMTVKSDNPDFPIHELTLKRSKVAPGTTAPR